MSIESVKTLTWGDYVPEEVVDIVLVMAEESVVPLVISPVSARAVKLFIQWGMPKEATGILAPFEPKSFFKILPEDWKVMSVPLKEGAHIVAEVPLPPRLHVVH